MIIKNYFGSSAPLWEKSLFYPACGFDIQPVLRFSHIIKNFIYVDWNVAPEEFNKNFFKNIDLANNKHPNLLVKLVGEPEVEVVDASGDLCQIKIGQDILFNILSSKEKKEYFRFSAQMKKDSLVISKYNFTRTICRNVERKLNLFFINAECFASYCAIFNNGDLAPFVLTTVNATSWNGFAELGCPFGIMNKFLESCKTKPEVWVRGNWGGHNALEREGLYRNLIQGFGKWECSPDRRTLVGAYAMDSSNLNKVKVVEIINARAAKIVTNAFKVDDNLKEATFFLTDHIFNKYKYELQGLKVVRIEDCSSLRVALENLDEYCRLNRVDHAVMFPVGFEDEGQCLRKWTNKNSSPKDLVVFCRGLDFYDLM